MSETAQPSCPSQSEHRPDIRFRLLLGVYVTALVVLPIAALWLPVLEGSAWPGLLTVLGAAVSLVAVTAVLARHVGGLAVRLGATPWRWALGIAPLCLLGALVFVETPMWGLFGAVCLTVSVVGFLLAVLGRTRFTAAIVDGATIRGEWVAQPAPARRRRLTYVAVSLVALGLAAFVTTSESIQALGQVTIAAAGGVYGARTSDRYRASDAGLEIVGLANRTLVPWQACTGYSVTDRAIVIHRPRLGRTMALDRDSVDLDAVVDVLSTHLDEQDG